MFWNFSVGRYVVSETPKMDQLLIRSVRNTVGWWFSTSSSFSNTSRVVPILVKIECLMENDVKISSGRLQFSQKSWNNLSHNSKAFPFYRCWQSSRRVSTCVAIKSRLSTELSGSDEKFHASADVSISCRGDNYLATVKRSLVLRWCHSGGLITSD